MAQMTTSWQLISTIGLSYGQIRTYAKYSSQSTATNQTTYQIRMVYYTNQSNGVSFSSATATLDGTQKGYGYTTMPRGETTILEVSRTITHNTDGSSPTKNIATSWSATYGGSGSTSANITFPKINRVAVTNSVVGNNIEGTFSVSYTKYVNSYTYKLRISVPNKKELERIDYNTSGETFTLSQATIDRIFNNNYEEKNFGTDKSNEVSLGFAVETWNGNTKLSVGNEKVITGRIENGNPIFNNFTFEDINATTLALTGNNQDVIKGYSKVQVTITTVNKAIAQKGATMSKYRLVIGNSSVDISYNDEETVSSIIDNVETGTINIYAIDSRGNSTMVTKLANREIDYDAVYTNINNSSFQRDDNRVGDNGVLTLNGTFWNDDFGDVNNSLAVSYRFKKSDSDTWINGTTSIVPTISNNTFSFTGMIASDNADTTWDLQSSYDLEITISDELTTSITNYVLASAIPTLSLDKEGVGIMCQYDTSLGGGLQVYGEPIGVEKKVVVDYLVETATNNLTFDLSETEETDIFEMYVLGTVNTTANQDISVQFNDITSGYYTCMMLQHTSGTADGNLTGTNIFRANKGQFYNGSSLGHTVSAMKYEFFVSNNRILCNWDMNVFGDGSALKGVGKSSGYINSYQTKINKIRLFATTTTTTKFNVGTRILIIKK